MYFNYCIYYLLLSIIVCYGDDNVSQDKSDKQDSNMLTDVNYKPMEVFNEGGGTNQRYIWPPELLRENVQDIWGKGVISKKLHDWPAVLPWAKGCSNSGFRRGRPLRKKRLDAFDGSGLIDIDPLTLNDRHKITAPKLRNDRRIWPYSLY